MARRKDDSPFLSSKDTKESMMDYLIFYSKIEGINKDKELTRRYPLIKPYISSIFRKKKQVTIKTNAELSSYNFNTVGLDELVFSKRHTNTICLLRHIRNGIAHWNLEYKDNSKDSIIIRDYNDEAKTKITCYGILTVETMNKILQLPNIKKL